MKHTFYILLLMILPFGSIAQSADSTALLVIDIQEFYFPGGRMALIHPEETAQKAALLIKYFREKGKPVIHIRHNSEPGGAIHKLVEPLPSEKVISKDEVNSFLNTGLDDHLKKLGIKKLVICGMQTHMCVEGATRAAHDLGYNCLLVEDACTTRDLVYKETVVRASDVHASTLVTLKNYATITDTEEFFRNNP
jgi:nicotinamidase-related amidase